MANIFSTPVLADVLCGVFAFIQLFAILLHSLDTQATSHENPLPDHLTDFNSKNGEHQSREREAGRLLAHSVKCSRSVCDSVKAFAYYFSTHRPILGLANHITLHVNRKCLLKRSSSHSHSSPVPQRFCLLSGLPTATVVLFQGEFQGLFS